MKLDTNKNKEEWAEPIPFDDYSTLPDFPIEVLPHTGHEIVKTVSEINQVDTGLTASIYLSILSACIAKKGEVDLISHKEPLNLFILSILPSGNRKSSTLNNMTKPVYDYQATKQLEITDKITEVQGLI